MRASLTVETTAVTFAAASDRPSATRSSDVARVSWSSSRTSQHDEEDEEEDDDETEEEEVGSVVEEGDVGREDFRVKPMSRLPVCPADDLVLEEEKRRRRSMRMLRAKQNRRNCADAESLPSPARRGLPAGRAKAPVPTAPRPPLSTPQLRRDSMAIRQQYMKQLGLNMSRRDLERSTGRITQRREGLKVALNDSRSKRGESKTIFQMIKSWYGANTATRSNSADEATILASDTSSETTSTSGSSESSSPRRKAVRFVEDAELFYIPLHCDYSKRQRDCMWHTRAEFIAMVERNLDDVYEEMEREYEEQVEMEMAENDAMAQEEARQREYEAHVKAQAQKAAEAKAAAATAAAATSPVRVTADTAASPPNLELCPIATQIKVTPRARTSHALRFKYLKHLGIDS
ncbi:hypothetical protein Poli38472_006462 [Pythium oligandrum]|uniref:Uncharacterized protein n=1 Tax=Pythium oligandrum TaxID=41045 RepID=A0A8K1C4P5_PYTOL|nr:hypothetical protein Poli38472_006462 [Pythium oligandrum]|eukprot:TMW56452.1 hypothetical protein Poli38472_006462 [Pythium oligandrum]